ncbi:MAG: peptidoglycan bridge formation glycyltransferase FemA/FemB family protein [Desulfurivibrionaceae bacterium]
MLVDLTPKNKDIVETGPLLQQTAFWGKVKEMQGCMAAAFDVRICAEGGTASEIAVGGQATDILVILRSAGPNKLVAHVPYGPRFEPPEELQGCFLEELSEGLRTCLPADCFFIRYDLPWQSPWADDPDCYNSCSEWQGPPREQIQEIRMNMETSAKNLRKAPTNILPTNTLFMDLREGKKDILGRMRAKTRYNIGLSRRKGVRVVEAGRRELDLWYKLYRETALRNNIVVHDKRYFQAMLEARRSLSNHKISLHLLLAEAEGDCLAGMFLAISADQAVYLYGASAAENRKKMGPYALQWEAIRLAKEKGCRYYDMFGVAPSAEPAHPMYGLYRFKTGFGGEIYHRQGCWDYPLDPQKYASYRAFELNDAGFHLKQ